MSPVEDRRLLAEVPCRIAAYVLVFRQIGLLKVCAAAQQQQLESVFSAHPVQLRSAAQRRAKIMQLNGVGRVKKAPGSKSIGKGIVAKPALCAAVLGVQVIVVLCGATKIQRSMVLHIAPGA